MINENLMKQMFKIQKCAYFWKNVNYLAVCTDGHLSRIFAYFINVSLTLFIAGPKHFDGFCIYESHS